jgi:hypothetical protein
MPDELQVEVSSDDVFEGIKRESQAKERASRDTGNVISWEGLQAALDTPDTRPAPTRTHTHPNPDRQQGVILSFDGSKEQVAAPMYEPDPNAEQEKRVIDVRKVGAFGEAEVAQVVTRRMKQGKADISLYLARDINEAYQMTGHTFGKHIVVVAPRYLAWEQGKYQWLLDEFDTEEGFVIGGQPQYIRVIEKFVAHIVGG